MRVNNKIHYGWILLFLTFFGLLAAQGISRWWGWSDADRTG